MTFTRALPFQSTFPRGERRGPYLIFLSPCRFQSTFPRGERHLCWLVAVKHIHFNPRSLVGNDYIPVGTYTIVEISIHVPSWGTTIFTRRQPPCILFQSTFPRGERRSSYWCLSFSVLFQSTFPRGERRKSEHKEEPEWQFQSTFPRGERHGVTSFLCLYKYFNPRSLVGNDLLTSLMDVGGTVISIHVPSWGTTKPPMAGPKPCRFQSTFPRGERLVACLAFVYLPYFNPRSLVGNDSVRLCRTL